jgi:hypothetical protein
MHDILHTPARLDVSEVPGPAWHTCPPASPSPSRARQADRSTGRWPNEINMTGSAMCAEPWCERSRELSKQTIHVTATGSCALSTQAQGCSTRRGRQRYPSFRRSTATILALSGDSASSPPEQNQSRSSSSSSGSKARRPYWSGIKPQPQIATGTLGTVPYSSSGSPFSGSTLHRWRQLSPRSKT